MMDSELEVMTLSRENQRLRTKLWRRQIVVNVLLCLLVCAIVVAAALVVSVQPITP